MRKLFYLFCIILTAIGCQNNQPNNMSETVSADTAKPFVDSVTTVQTSNGKNCFAYIKNQDTILLTLNLKDTLATGKLVYNLYEKDKNTGTFNGFLRHDTLIANYTFLSEGMTSVRQVAFLLKGDILQQGSGNMKDQNGRLVFTNKKDIVFDNNILLEAVDCDSFDKK